MVEAPFSKNELVELFVGGGIGKGIAEGLADAEPTVSDDQLTAVLTHDQHTVIVYSDSSVHRAESSARFKLIGTPADPADLIHFNYDDSIVAYSTSHALNFFNVRDSKLAAINAESEYDLGWKTGLGLSGRTLRPREF